MSIGTNIRNIRKEKGWTQEDLARRVNISRGRIAQIEKDPNTDVKADTLLSLAKAFGCSLDALRSGWDGSSTLEPPQNFANIPILNVELAAGLGSYSDFEQVTDRMPISRDWIFENQLPEPDLVVVKVSGDSMLPRLQDGDMLLVNTADKQPVSGKVYAIAVDTELRVKRLHKQLNGNWVISSDNKQDPSFQDEVVPAHSFNQVRILGRAVKVLMGDL